MKLATLAASATLLASAAALAQTAPAQPGAQPAAQAQPPGQDPAAMAKPDVARIQDALVKAGYDPGATDGSWTPQSTTALNLFVANRALPATNGRVDHSVLSALGLNKPQ